MVEKTSDIRVFATELSKIVKDVTRRIRLVEERVERDEVQGDNLERAINVQSSEAKLQLESMTKNIKLMSDRVSMIESALNRIEKEMTKRATKAEVKQLDAYLSLMSPMTSKFVTKEEMERAIEEKTTKKY